MGCLVDTSIIIAWERGKLDSERVRARFESQSAYFSAITASELLHGVHRADTAVRRGRRQAFVERLLSTVPVLPIDMNVARTHARLWADQQAAGQMIGAHDLLIAATAMTHELSVATHNLRDFSRVSDLTVDMW